VLARRAYQIAIARELYLLFGHCLFVVCLIAPAASDIAFWIASATGAPPKSARLRAREVSRKLIPLAKGMYPSHARSTARAPQDMLCRFELLARYVRSCATSPNRQRYQRAGGRTSKLTAGVTTHRE
jgi:hypothetical protein